MQTHTRNMMAHPNSREQSFESLIRLVPNLATLCALGDSAFHPLSQQ